MSEDHQAYPYVLEGEGREIRVSFTPGWRVQVAVDGLEALSYATPEDAWRDAGECFDGDVLFHVRRLIACVGRQRDAGFWHDCFRSNLDLEVSAAVERDVNRLAEATGLTQAEIVEEAVFTLREIAGDFPEVLTGRLDEDQLETSLTYCACMAVGMDRAHFGIGAARRWARAWRSRIRDE